MRRICLSFDDGRLDNYTYAFPILDKHSLLGTFFITTGYIDHTYAPTTWTSSEGPMSIDNIRELQKYGHEIGLHGDQHLTSNEDFLKCYNKACEWLEATDRMGYSIPGSRLTDCPMDEFLSSNKDRLLYVRGGNIGGGKNRIIRKIRKALCVYTNSTYFYKSFNCPNIINMSENLPRIIPSIGVRLNDSSEKVIELIESMHDSDFIVLMLHSILPNSSPYYGNTLWSWSAEKFNDLCSYIEQKESLGVVKSVTLRHIIVEKESYHK